MARRRKSLYKKTSRKKNKIRLEDTATIVGVIFFILSVLSFASLLVNSNFLLGFKRSFGYGVPIAAFLFLATSFRMFGAKMKFNTAKVLFGLVVFLLSFITLLHLLVPMQDAKDIAMQGKMGGLIGYNLSQTLSQILSPIGAIIVLIPIVLVSICLSLSIPIVVILRGIRNFMKGVVFILDKTITPMLDNSLEKLKGLDLANGKQASDLSVNGNQWQPSNPGEGMRLVGDLSGKNSMKNNENINVNEEVPSHLASSPNLSPHKAVTAESTFDEWKYPPLSLLNVAKPASNAGDNVKKNADIIEKTLESFGILAKVADISVGPTVTQYALQITMGTKVAKVHNLSKDLALALAAPSGQVRIEAPIPGTSLVGIEMPNTYPKPVTLREVMESPEMLNGHHRLGLAMGKDVSGKPIVKDLQKMPHILIAGATGSGKSVAINAFIISLLFQYSPNELKFILVDPKQVELSGYNGIPHLLTPVITDIDKVINALKFVIAEMENRYKMFKEVNARNLESYNDLPGVIKLPYLVIIVDEMADLMLQKGIEIESSVVRLAQMARATGIHLILATQRPSVDVITGLIKANIPARIALAVTSLVDSRVILDQMGAESLVGRGDMLFKNPDTSGPTRVQGVWVTDEEVEKVVNFIKEETVKVEYNDDVIKTAPSSKGYQDSEYSDTMFPDAVRVVVNAQRGSASILQSKLRIGYARAARLIEELEEKGVVGPADGSKPRDVLVSDSESFLGTKNQDMP